MPKYYRRQSSEDELAEMVTQAVVAVAMVGLVILGAIFVGAFREIGLCVVGETFWSLRS